MKFRMRQSGVDARRKTSFAHNADSYKSPATGVPPSGAYLGNAIRSHASFPWGWVISLIFVVGALGGFLIFVSESSATKCVRSAQEKLTNAAQYQKKWTPETETPTEFLKRNFSPLMKVAIDGQQKSEAQQLLEEMLVLRPRQKAPGRWIDLIESTPPKSHLPDIKPLLDDKTICSDENAVLSHWPLFMERCPRTAQYIVSHGWKPGPIPMLTNGFDFGETGVHDFLFRYNTSEDPLKFVGAMLLYADFLYARGGLDAKKMAFNICASLYTVVVWDLQSERATDDKASALTISIAEEMVWRMDDREKGIHENLCLGQYCAEIKQKTYSDFCKNMASHNGARHPDFIRAVKWMIANHESSSNRQDSWGNLIALFNAYAADKDRIAQIIISHVLDFECSDSMAPDAIDLMHDLMVKEFGRVQGNIFFRRYLSICVKKFPEEHIQKRLQALK